MTLAALAVLLCGAPAADAGRTLFAADTSGNRVFGFGVADDGSITSLPGFPVFSGQGPTALVPGRDAAHLYATFSGASSVGVYDVSAAGSLTPAGSPVATGLSPSAAAVSPDGTQLFVANAGVDSISRFAIGIDGSLTSLGDTVPTGDQPSGLAMTPDGAHLYAANAGDDTLSVFGVSSQGAVTAIGPPVAAGDGATGLAVTPDGQHLYSANANAGTVRGWSIATDGSLTSLGDATATGTGARGIAVSPDGARALVANPGAGTVSSFLIASSGTLVSAGGATAGPAGAMSVVISPDGRHAYVGGSSSLSAFDYSSVGGLSLRSGSPVATNGLHGAVAITPNQAPQAKPEFVAAPATRPSTFEGGASVDPDGTVTHWEWDFGDGAHDVGHTATHTYPQPGTYTVTLKVKDNEGCATAMSYTGQFVSCVGSPYAAVSQSAVVVDSPPQVAPDPPCIHDGDDGFCGTPDRKAPRVDILGFTDGSSISTLDAPTEIVGTITPDPSGISEVRLRFTKAAGTLIKRTTPTRRLCRKVKGKKRCKRVPIYKKTCRTVHGKRRCTKKKVVKSVDSKVPLCLTVSGTKNFLVKYQCSKAPWVVVPGGATFLYSLPVALGTGKYTIDAIATDGAGNTDVLEDGRTHMTFTVVNAPSNQSDGSGGGPTTTPTGSTPIDDTGSPFGTG